MFHGVISDKVSAPWTDEQLARLQQYQETSCVHPFTCPCSGESVLIPEKDGWICPRGCGRKQTWAHTFMVDGSVDVLIEKHEAMMAKVFGENWREETSG